jgi:hypothetical protein
MRHIRIPLYWWIIEISLRRDNGYHPAEMYWEVGYIDGYNDAWAGRQPVATDD